MYDVCMMYVCIYVCMCVLLITTNDPFPSVKVYKEGIATNNAHTAPIYMYVCMKAKQI